MSTGSLKWAKVTSDFGKHGPNDAYNTNAVKRHCTDWYEILALTDHEINYIKIELDLRKFSNGPFSETEKGF